MFGVYLPAEEFDSKGRTKKIIVQITDDRKLKQFFSVVEDFDRETGFRKVVKTKGHVDIVVTNEKPFVLAYNVKAETITVKCHHGAWNELEVAQYI
jgi:predicted P-loop ATPase